MAKGGYDHVAEALFGELAVDGFVLEYDDSRSGRFEPLRFVSRGSKRVVRARYQQTAGTRKHGRIEKPERRSCEIRAA
jgi:hypothetical protein